MRKHGFTNRWAFPLAGMLCLLATGCAAPGGGASADPASRTQREARFQGRTDDIIQARYKEAAVRRAVAAAGRARADSLAGDTAAIPPDSLKEHL